jgi:phage terminase large subunit-like protein
LRAAGLRVDGWDECVPAVCTYDTGLAPGAWFDVAAVVKVVKALRAFRHTKGRWSSSPLDPDPWQVVWIIAPIYGWKNPDGTRVVRTVWIEVPRKNGKSTVASGLALVGLVADGEPGAEVYSAAASLPQAELVFNDARNMARTAKALQGKAVIQADLIKVPATGAIFRALSKVAEVAHGLNVSTAIVDEVHVHKRRDLIDAIETGTGARDQPLVIFITTADEGDDYTIYAEKHTYTRRVAEGVVSDPTSYGVIWAAEDDDDAFVESTWRKANPGLGISPKLEYLAKEAARAREVPSYYPTFCRLHLNRRMRQQVRWLPMGAWDQSAGMVDPAELAGRECWAGLDLSAVSDLTSLVLVFADPHNPAGVVVVPQFWLPADALPDLERQLRVPLDRWRREGFLHTSEGATIELDDVEAEIRRVNSVYRLRRLSYDRMFAGQMVQHLDAAGIPTAAIAQTLVGLGPGSKELERLVLNGDVRHGGHPVLRWNVSDVEVVRDGNDNIKPVKPDRAQTTRRIDGVTALVMGLDGWIRRERPKRRRVVGY